VIGVPVRHDDECQMALRRFIHIFDGFNNRTDISGTRRSFEYSTIDQDVLIAGRRGHGDKEEITKTDPIHSNSEAAPILRIRSSRSSGACFPRRSLAGNFSFSCSHIRTPNAAC
jgi:hypothetical protein